MPNTHKVFAYGTLQLPEVMRAVTKADFPACPAVLPGYARYALKGLAYPGLRAQAGTRTEGVLYGGVDAEALRRLDGFEDDFYRRESLRVRLESGAAVTAEVYVVPPEHYSVLLPEPWDLARFRETALAGFMARCHAGE